MKGASGEVPSGDPEAAGDRVLFELAEEVGEALRGRGWTLAVAESCTGGWVTKAITDVSGSSSYLVGGVSAYADRVKGALLGVPAEILSREGAVSEATARAMAEGAVTRLGSHVGLSVTGIAGPGGGRPGRPVGTVWFALALPNGIRSEMMRFEGGREAVRRRATAHALRMLRRALGDGRSGARQG